MELTLTINDINNIALEAGLEFKSIDTDGNPCLRPYMYDFAKILVTRVMQDFVLTLATQPDYLFRSVSSMLNTGGRNIELSNSSRAVVEATVRAMQERFNSMTRGYTMGINPPQLLTDCKDGAGHIETTPNLRADPIQAPEILGIAREILAERGVDYDAKNGERSMERVVNSFNAKTGHNLSVVEGWLFMVDLKSVRALQNPKKLDNFVDGAAYFALAGEVGE